MSIGLVLGDLESVVDPAPSENSRSQDCNTPGPRPGTAHDLGYDPPIVAEYRSTSGVAGVPGEHDPDLLAALRRRWGVIVMFAVIGAGAGWLYSSTLAVTFEARSTLLLIAAGTEEDPGGGRDRTLDVDTWATVARSTEVLAEVAAELELDLDDVRARTTAIAAPTGDVMVITFEAPTSDEAVDGAAVYSSIFLETRRTAVNSSTVEREQQLNTLATDVNADIQRISDEIDVEEQRGEFASQSRLSVLISAQQRAINQLADINAELVTLDDDVETGRVLIDPSTAVDRAGLGRNLIVLSGLFTGLLLGLIAALLKDRYDDRLDSATDAEALGINEIARVPHVDSLRRVTPPDGYSRLATKLTFVRRRNLETGRTVLLLPVESRTMPTDAAVSIAAAIEQTASDAAISVSVWVDDGAAQGSRAFWSSASDSLDELKAVTDLVVVPALPLDQSSIGIALAALVDTAVLVVSEQTPVREIQSALDDLAGNDAHTGDVVVLTSIRRRHVNPTSARRQASADADPAAS